MAHFTTQNFTIPPVASEESGQPSQPSRWSFWITTVSFFLALLAFIFAPSLAMSWSKIPFPGFVIEQSGVVANIGRQGWSGRDAGIDHPQRISAFNNQPVEQPSDFFNILRSLHSGQGATVETVEPNGLTRFFTYVEIGDYPVQDLVKFFWLPYLIGLVYFLIGGVIYVLRGKTRAGLSFAFFCACTSVVCALSFDVSTTHRGTAFWTLANSLLGGAILGLAMLFPTELEAIRRKSRVRIFTYALSLGLTVWGWLALYSSSNPWGYISPWRMSFFYTAFSLAFLFGMLFYRLRKNPSIIERQQIRIILFGSLVAFIIIMGWLLSPLLNVFLAWDPAFFMPFILIFPLSVGVAILRYRLWAIDVIIRRTLVYGILTGALGLIYFISVVLFSQVFKVLIGETSSLAIVISTLIIATLFTPLRKRVQHSINRRLYRSQYDAEKALAAFAAVARDEVDLEILKTKLLQLVQDTVQPEQVGLWLKNEEHKS
jgi:hypothetical protein